MNSFKTLSRKTMFGMGGLVLLCSAVTAQAATLPVTANLVTQLDGTDISSTGGLVDSWNDQALADGADDFTQAGGTRPTLVSGALLPNGSSHDVVQFAGSHTLTTGPDPDLDTATQSWYMVIRVDTAASNTAQGAYGLHYKDGPVGTATATPASRTKLTTGITSGNVGNLLRKASGAQDVNAGLPVFGPAAGEWILVSSQWNGTAAEVNGLAATGSAFRAFDSTGTLQTSLIRIGIDGVPSPGDHEISVLGNRGDSHGARFFDGAFAELLVYNDILTAGEQASVETYLLDKYFSAVPEPGSMALLALGSCCLGFVRRRRS